MPVLPMFPLGHVLLPSTYLPLHLFEPRYLELVQVCLDGDQEFGVVLIERGSEVGGGDTRTHVGCVARILEASRFEDGRWAIGAVGTRRIRVERWLPDDPYPRAEVTDWPEPEPSRELAARVAEVLPLLRRVLAVRAELGDASAPATVELADDPVLASYQFAAVGPFGPADQQALLEARDAAERVERLAHLLAEEDRYLSQRLAMPADDDPPPG
jgi:Lon protease-like protein